MLTPEIREKLSERIRERALAFAVASATVEEIDRLNILRAALLAMQRAVAGLGMVPDAAWIDGNHCPELPCKARAIVRGDARCGAIAAASILAKTARDAEMRRLHEQYPQYRFDQHKGYATPGHLALIDRFGFCEIHRRSFMPMRDLFAGIAA